MSPLLFYVILTLLPPTLTHGIGIPPQYVNPAVWADEHPDVPFVSWNSEHCDYPEFTPMLWRNEAIPANCRDGRDLYLFNEPEFESQGNLKPWEAANIVRKYRDWPGRIFCCGTTWYGIGWIWFTEFLDALGSDVDIIDGLNVHPYTGTKYHLYKGNYREFAALAKERGWPVVISEFGITEADRVLWDWFYNLVVDLYNPEKIFAFSWYYAELADLNLSDGRGNLTEYGEWWQGVMASGGATRYVYIPMLGR